MKYKFCEGCLDKDRQYPDDGTECIENNFDGSCPCTVCLVKTMCGLNCDAFMDHWNSP